MSKISINARSSIRIEGTKVVYFDPFKIGESEVGERFRRAIMELTRDIEVEVML